mmetsp:Transcript_55269/g.158921  ORF Transcript_55269/g.158921 Transcript_55269/m.158921 type:complete len:919 (+) Transcript_55269:69-2825(+)
MQLSEAPTKLSIEDLCALGSQGVSAWQGGRLAEAKHIFEQLCALDVASPLWSCWLARLHCSMNEDADALAVCQAGLSREPQHAELLLLRGRMHLQVGDRDRARADLLQARAVGGLGQVAVQDLVGGLRQLGESVANRMAAPTGQGAATVVMTPCSFVSSPKTAAATTVLPKEVPVVATAVRAQFGSTASESKTDGSVNDTIKSALVEESKGYFARSKKFCEEALRCKSDAWDAVLCLARLELNIGNGAEVRKILRKDYPIVFRNANSRVEALTLAAAAAEVEGDWDEAAADLELAAKVAKPISASGSPTPVQGGHLKFAPGAPGLEDILGRLARAQFRAGERETAAALAQNVLESSPVQREACEVACTVLLDRGDSATALAVMLRCLIGHRNRPSSESADLVCGVMRRCSVEELLHVLAPKGQDALEQEQRKSVAEVVAYVGLIMKERSEVLDACRLYRRSVLLAPSHASLFLNLMHTFALRRDDLPALAWGLRYFDELLSCGKVLAARAICEALRNGASEGGREGPESAGSTLTPEVFGSTSAFYDTIAIGFVLVKLLFLSHPYSSLVPAHKEDQASETRGFGPPVRPTPVPPWRSRLLSLSVDKTDVSTKPTPLIGTPWISPTCENLPSGCSAADVAAGEAMSHRGVLRRLAATLDSARRGRNLHLTPVRNEHAYFSCIRDILEGEPPAVPAHGNALEPLYVIGDSHVLSSAWRIAGLPPAQGRPDRIVLVPCLVTGAKIWHMREDSNFYTKFLFWERISCLPKGAPVIINLGEIDCRESVLRSVQQGKHASVETALTALIGLYLELLQEVRRRLPGSRLFVHPVANVLPESRFLTLAFNHLLAAPATQHRFEKIGVQLLSFAPVLEGGEPSPGTAPKVLAELSLVEALRLDGTHMAPAYVASHLAPALAVAWPAE